MMDNRIKILLPSKRRVTGEDVDIFLNVDLRRQIDEFKKERLDNDFDLAAQFIKERNTSRNFIIYGVLDSTVVDCPGLSIRVYRDAGRQHQIAIIEPSAIAYDKPNVFGKHRGKYYIKLSNYKYDVVYFRIESNNLTYRDQEWEQRVVFYDADGIIVPYGSATIDINSDGETSLIENDFPFFFNKHWIRNDYDIIEEKQAKVTFDITQQQLSEGESGQLLISLDKPSPFGLEVIALKCMESSSTAGFFLGSTFNDVGQGNDIIKSIPDGPYAGRMTFLVQVPLENVHLISAGVDFKVLTGSYVGLHTIVSSFSVIIEPNSDLYQVILDVNYDPSGTNNVPMDYRAGSSPDITFSMNGTVIDLPINLYWQQNERIKTLSFSANTDFEIEFTEYVDLGLRDLLYCEPGRFVESRIVFEDTTTRNYVSLFLGPTYENSVYFTGRTFYQQNILATQTLPSYSVLRNGYRYEGRGEEFYPSSGYKLKIKNEGNRTLFPVNPLLGVEQESIFDIGEVKSFYLPTRFIGPQRHSIKLQFSLATGWFLPDGNESVVYSINGFSRFIGNNGYTGYNTFKRSIGTPEYDSYQHYQIEQPFDAVFNDTGLTVVMTSKSPGVKLDFRTNDPAVTATTLVGFYEKEQEEYNIQLLANSEENTKASYSFTLEKNGFRSLLIPRTELDASETSVPYYLVTSYGSILRPYYQDLGQPYYGSGSTIDDQFLQYWQVNQVQPSYMERGSAFVNGICFLADNIIYNTKENLTNYGLGEGLFTAGFLPQRVTPLTNTFETTVVTPTFKTVELTIYSHNPYTPPYSRSFDFRYGSSGNETVYTFGGNLYGLRNLAEWWWTNNVPAVDQNGTSLPASTLQERLDTGNVDNSIDEGPVYGQLLSNNVIRFTAKVAGMPYYVENIVNYVDAYTTGKIIKTDVVPNQQEGDYNLGNNGLGGFAISL